MQDINKLKFTDFAQQVLLDGFEKDLIGKSNYYAFATMYPGIELLGTIHDSYSFDHFEEGMPTKRFKKGISLLAENSNPRYNNYITHLYKSYRCGFAHQFRPQKKGSSGVLLASNHKGAKNVHLTVIDNDVLLEIGEFFADYKKTWEVVIEELKRPDMGTIGQSIDIHASARVGKLSDAQIKEEVKEKKDSLKKTFLSTSDSILATGSSIAIEKQLKHQGMLGNSNKQKKYKPAPKSKIPLFPNKRNTKN